MTESMQALAVTGQVNCGSVIPANAGIQPAIVAAARCEDWIPAFAGMKVTG